MDEQNRVRCQPARVTNSRREKLWDVVAFIKRIREMFPE